MRLLCAADGDELGGALGHEERAVSVAGDVAVLEDQPALLDDARPELVLLDLAAGENNDTNNYDTQLSSSPLVLLDLVPQPNRQPWRNAQGGSLFARRATPPRVSAPIKDTDDMAI